MNIYRKRKNTIWQTYRKQNFFKSKDPTWGRELNFLKKLIRKKKI